MKAFEPMYCRLGGKETDVKELQEKNAPNPILVMLVGDRSSERRPVEANAPCPQLQAPPITLRDAGNVIVCKAPQF